jgi:hypothetical protein
MNSNHGPHKPVESRDGNPTGNPSNIPMEYSRRLFLDNSLEGYKRPKPYGFYDQDYEYGIEGGRWKRSYARIVHLLPSFSPIDVYLDGKLFYSGLRYQGVSDYMSVRPGNHRIIFCTIGRRSRPIYYKTLFIPRRGIVSMVVHGLSTGPDVIVLDDKTTVPTGRSKVKIVHLAPYIPAVDLLAGRWMWFNEIIYQEASEYIPIPAGRETLTLRASETKHIIFTLPNAYFGRNRAHTVYVTKQTHSISSINLFITQDG